MILRINPFTLALCAALLVTGGAVLAPFLPIRPQFVTSRSVPVGIYLIDTRNKSPEPGQMLAFVYDAPSWAADRYLPSGSTFIKYTLGAPGDTVLAHDGEIRVCQESNLLGQPYLACLTAGHTLARDTAGRPMTAYPLW